MRMILPLHTLLLMSSMQTIAHFDGSSFLNHQVRSLSTAVTFFPFWKNAYAFWFEQQMADDYSDEVPELVKNFVRSVLFHKGIDDESDIEITFEPCGDNPVNAEYSHNSLCICSSPSYLFIDNKNIEFDVNSNGKISFDTSEISQEDALCKLIENYETIVANLHDALNLKKRIEQEIKITQKKVQLMFLQQTLNHVNNLLEEYVAVIQHEAGHHHHKVTRALMRANIISPIVLSVLCAASCDLIKTKLVTQEMRGASICEVFLSVLANLATYGTTTCFLAWFDRHQEWKADEFVDSNPRILMALKRTLQRIEQCENTYCCCSKKSWFKRSKNMVMNYLLANEPSVASRLKRVDQRLASVDC